MTESRQKHKRHGLLSAVGALMLGSGLSAGLSFVLTALLARFLTSADFTLYTLTLAWTFPALLAAEFGLSSLFLRDIAANLAATRSLLRRLLPLRLALSGVVALSFIGGAGLSHAGLSVLHLLIASPLLFTLPLFNLMSAVLRARARMGWVAALNVGMLVAQVGLLMLRSTWRADEALLLNTLTAAGQLLAAVWIVQRITRNDIVITTSFCARDWLCRCWPFAVANVLGAIQLRLALLLIDQRFPPVETAAYIVAARFAEAARLLLVALLDAFYPRLSAAATDGSLERWRRWLLWATTMYAAAAAIALQGSALIIVVGFPLEYWPAVPLLPAVGVAFLVATLRAGIGLYCYAVGHEHIANGATLATIAGITAVGLSVTWADLRHFLLTAAAVEAVLTAVQALLIARAAWRAATTPPYIPAG